MVIVTSQSVHRLPMDTFQTAAASPRITDTEVYGITKRLVSTLYLSEQIEIADSLATDLGGYMVMFEYRPPKRVIEYYFRFLDFIEKGYNFSHAKILAEEGILAPKY